MSLPSTDPVAAEQENGNVPEPTSGAATIEKKKEKRRFSRLCSKAFQRLREPMLREVQSKMTFKTWAVRPRLKVSREKA
jgi:hypothetical protein